MAPVRRDTNYYRPEPNRSAVCVSLTRDLLNYAGQETEEDAYFNLTAGSWAYSTSSATLGTSGTNYYATTYGYDANGLLDRTETPTTQFTEAFIAGKDGNLALGWAPMTPQPPALGRRPIKAGPTWWKPRPTFTTMAASATAT